MKRRSQRSRLHRRDQIVGWLMVIFTLIYLLPIFFMLINAFKPLREVLVNTAALPKSLYLDNFITIWEEANYPVLLKNSVIITGLSLLGVVLTSSMAGYYIARHHSRLTKIVNVYFVLAIVVPFQAVMIPLVKLMADLHLSDNIYGMVLLYIAFASPMSIFLYIGAVKGVPISLEEAARSDGAGWFRTFWQIVFPLLRPITCTVIALNSFWIWNDFLPPLILLTSEANKTIPVGVMGLIMGQYSFDMSGGLAAAIYSVIPMILIYLSLQKYFVSGLAAGAVKN